MDSERLTYRRPGQSDLGNLHKLDNDPEVMRWINGGEPVSVEQFRKQLLPVLMDVNHEHLGFWIIEAGGEFIGWVSLREAKSPGTASIGYRLRRSAWGKGYATEAARAVLDHAFTAGNLGAVVATTYESNVGSRKVLEKIGMKLVRRFRMTDSELAAADTSVNSGEVWDLDDLEFEITASEYHKAAS